MGLDNGIYWKPRNNGEKNIAFPDYVEFSYDSVENEYEVCCWRKCWGLRGNILDIIDNNAKVKIDGEDYGYELTRVDLIKIQNILFNYFKHPDWWDEENNFWSFNDIKECLAQNIVNLGWMIKYMRMDNPMALVYFIDSY